MTNASPVFDHSFQTVVSLVKQVESWPSSVLLVVLLIILGSALHRSERISDRDIPWIMLVVGAVMNVLIGDVASVPPTQRNPEVILGMWGFCLGAIAWFSHRTWLKKFKRFVPLINGDHPTEPPFKPQ